jgi:hypothetical protein
MMGKVCVVILHAIDKIRKNIAEYMRQYDNRPLGKQTCKVYGQIKW